LESGVEHWPDKNLQTLCLIFQSVVFWKQFSIISFFFMIVFFFFLKFSNSFIKGTPWLGIIAVFRQPGDKDCLEVQGLEP